MPEMPDKVQLTPLEAKIFEGKAPPTSWFNENVVRFLQIKTEQEFLHDFLSYVKELQSEKLSKTISAPRAKEAALAKLPPEASSETVRNTYLYNALLPAFKTELDYLEKLIALVQKANPQLAKELDEFLTELKTIAKGFPELNSAQIAFLNLMIKNLRNYALRLPIASLRKYFDTEFNMFNKMMQELDEFLKDGANELKDTEGNLQSIANLKKGVSSLEEMMVKVRQTKQFSPEDLNQLLAFLQLFAEGHSQLSPQIKKRIESFLKALEALKAMNGQKLPEVLSDSLLQKWIQEFLKSNPDGTVSQLREYLVNFFDKSNLKKTSLPFLDDLADSIKVHLKNRSFPYINGNAGVPLIHERNGKLTINEELNQMIAQRYTVDGRSTTPITEAGKGLTEGLKGEETQLQNHKEGLGAALAAGQETRDSLGRSAAPAAASSLGDSVADDYKNAVLDRFIPYQEEYLMDLSFVLYFDNYGAEMGNQLLNHVMDFQDAQTNYSFYNNLHSAGTSDTNEYIGTWEHVQAELDQEITQAGRDLKKVESTLSYIDNKMRAIESDRTMNAHQKAVLIHRLERYRDNLKAAKIQLTSLSNALSEVHVQAKQGNPADCQVWMTDANGNNIPLSTLNSAEGDVINGYANPPPGGVATGGLVNIQNMIQTDQEDSSDQGQNMQMRLQMHMTEFQQQMTIGSTGLQILNQAYMVLAQAIYK